MSNNPNCETCKIRQIGLAKIGFSETFHRIIVCNQYPLTAEHLKGHGLKIILGCPVESIDGEYLL